MIDRTIQAQRVSITRAALAGLPTEERNLLFFAGHAINELNSLNKVLGWCLTGHVEERASELVSLAQGLQGLVYARILAGKVWEAWQALRSSWFIKGVANRLQPLLHQDPSASLVALKTYFRRVNLIKNVRNSFAFHYSADALGKHWTDAIYLDQYEAIFGGTIGNNLNLGAEMVANASLLRGVGANDVQQNLHTFFSEVQNMANHMTTFLEGITVVITEKAIGAGLGTAAKQERVPVTQSYSEVSIPYFCAPDGPQE